MFGFLNRFRKKDEFGVESELPALTEKDLALARRGSSRDFGSLDRGLGTEFGREFENDELRARNYGPAPMVPKEPSTPMERAQRGTDSAKLDLVLAQLETIKTQIKVIDERLSLIESGLKKY